MEKIKKALFVIVLWGTLIYFANAIAKTYNNHVTMDVNSELGWASGTYICKDAATCMRMVRSAEERGAHQYCNSVVMKRGNRVIWFKNYQPKISIR